MCYVTWFTVMCLFVCFLNVSSCKRLHSPSSNLTIITRAQWGANAPTAIQELETPVPYVVIHHSSIPGACYSLEECSAAMRAMQYSHQFENQWADIGYNFAIGSDGLAYEGRGWDRVGAHAPGYNTQGMGIVLIGHWVSEKPPKAQLQTTKDLIAEGIVRGYIDPRYSLVGHRQVRATECPGDALYRELESWAHFQPAIQMN